MILYYTGQASPDSDNTPSVSRVQLHLQGMFSSDRPKSTVPAEVMPSNIFSLTLLAPQTSWAGLDSLHRCGVDGMEKHVGRWKPSSGKSRLGTSSALPPVLLGPWQACSLDPWPSLTPSAVPPPWAHLEGHAKGKCLLRENPAWSGAPSKCKKLREESLRASGKTSHCLLSQMVVSHSVWSLSGIGMGEWAPLHLPKVQKYRFAPAVLSFGDSDLMLDQCLIGRKLRRVFWRDQNQTQSWTMSFASTLNIHSHFLHNLWNGYNYPGSWQTPWAASHENNEIPMDYSVLG